jgi:hypothetical protein
MADNIAVTAGTGTTIAADEVGAAYYQRVKISIGADGSATDWPVNSGNVGATIPRVTLATDDAAVATVVTAINGSVADGDADSGNSSKVAGIAKGSLSAVTLDTAGDRSPFVTGLDRVLIVRPYVCEDLVSGVAAITDGTSTSVIASSGAGVKTYITDAVVANSSATALTVDLRDGAAGSVKATFMVPAGSAAHKTFVSPLAGSAATAWCADPSTSASTITVTLTGFKSKV